jgi:hypothetical protein
MCCQSWLNCRTNNKRSQNQKEDAEEKKGRCGRRNTRWLWSWNILICCWTKDVASFYFKPVILKRISVFSQELQQLLIWKLVQIHNCTHSSAINKFMWTDQKISSLFYKCTMQSFCTFQVTQYYLPYMKICAVGICVTVGCCPRPVYNTPTTW